jgi:pimeloyl-ACP methyl ester carboxylesterase
MTEQQHQQSTSQPAVRVIEALPASRPEPALVGFEHRFQTVDGVRLHYVAGGNPDGDVVVLIAGFPESWFAWRKVMPLLATTYRIIAPDLPGQGDSDRPAGGYDTQALAVAVHGLIQQLGITQYFLAAHDVGAWVAYPYAALFGGEIRRLVVMDAGIPGITLPDALPTAPERAWRTWHFAFHALSDLPEMLITGREREYLDWFLRRKAANPETFTDADMNEYLRIFKKEGGLRAGLSYYRAAALSAQQNRALCARGKLKMPILALGSDQGSIVDMASPLKAFADDVQGGMIANCGHFLPEEQPAAIALELTTFFGPSSGG